jgi:hypothetical protein
MLVKKGDAATIHVLFNGAACQFSLLRGDGSAVIHQYVFKNNPPSNFHGGHGLHHYQPDGPRRNRSWIVGLGPCKSWTAVETWLAVSVIEYGIRILDSYLLPFFLARLYSSTLDSSSSLPLSLVAVSVQLLE